MSDRAHEELPREYSEYDRRQPVEDVGQETHDRCQQVSAFFCEIEPGADTDWQADHRSNGNEDESSNDRVGHSAAGFANRPRHLSEESGPNVFRAFPYQMNEYQKKRQRRDCGGDISQPKHDTAL